MPQEKIQEKITEDRHRLYEQLQHGPDKWVYHVANLNGSGDVRTELFDRPVRPLDRAEAIGRFQPVDQMESEHSVSISSLFQRRLTGRAPYQGFPLSYLRTWGRSWDVAPAESVNGTIAWSNAGIFDEVRRPGVIEFDFWNVTVESNVLITLAVTTMAEAGRTGQLKVSGNPPITGSWAFPVVGGYSDHTFDLNVHLPVQSLVTLRLEIGEGVMLFHFHELTYTTL